eukprot:COSAG01_NODE_246_length_20450_cov_195.166822_12_plen_97_part_00
MSRVRSERAATAATVAAAPSGPAPADASEPSALASVQAQVRKPEKRHASRVGGDQADIVNFHVAIKELHAKVDQEVKGLNAKIDKVLKAVESRQVA